MQRQQMPEKSRPHHRPQRREIPLQDLRHADFVMAVRFLEERQVAFEAGFALALFDGGFHAREVGGEFEGLAVGEPDVVVGFAFLEMDVFGREGGPKVVEGFLEETGEEEQRRSLVEALGVAKMSERTCCVF